MKHSFRAPRSARTAASSLGALLLLVGCASAPYPEMQFYGNDHRQEYRSNAELYERSGLPLSEFAARYPGQTFYVCSAYYKIRNYSRFLECREALAVSVQDAEGFEGRTDALDVMFAEYLVATGAHDAAFELALGIHDRGLDKQPGAGSVLSTALFSSSFGEMDARSTNPIYSIRPLMASARFSGDAAQLRVAVERSRAVRADIEATASIVAGETGVDLFYKALLAQMAIAQDDYETAFAEATRGYRAGVGSVLLAVGTVTGMSALMEATGEFDTERFNLAHMLALSAFKTGRYEIAKAQYLALIEAPLFKQQKGANFHAYHHLGLIHLREGEIETGIEFLKQAVEALEAERSTIDTEAARIGFVGDRQKVYADLVAALVGLGRGRAALEYAERGKARALVDLLASKPQIGVASRPEEVREAVAELDRLERARQLGAPGEPGAGARGILEVRTALRRAAPETASLVSVEPVRAKDVQRHLREDEAVVEYFYGSADAPGERQLHAFVVGRERVEAHVLSADGLEADVRDFRAAIDQMSEDEWRELASSLYQRLIAPMAQTLAGTRHLTIVPHGALHYLPFNALLDEDGRHLIRSHTVRLLPSASVLRYLDDSSSPSRNLLVLGNPDLARPDMDLPGAQAEARAVAGLWPESRVVLREQASETLVKRSAAAYRYLHLASHGQFDPEEPLNSRMLLAADSENDGDLTVSEIYDLELNADLVVLSACQTALGDVSRGDDVVGLNRGFLYAGARSIVGSLWEVPDAPTRDLMISLYENLETMDLRDAMQAAQLSTLERHGQPIAWAAFQVTGGS